MTAAPAQLDDSGADTATTQWQRWSTTMQIVVTDPDSLAAAREEVDAELGHHRRCRIAISARFGDQRAGSVSRPADSDK